MNKNKFLMAFAAVLFSILFALPQIMGVNISAKADDEPVSQEEETSSDTNENENEEEEAPLPSFAVIDDILYVAPGVTLSEILENLEGAVSIDTGKEEAAEEDPTVSDEEEEEAPAEEETSEPDSEEEEEEEEETGDIDGENEDETGEPEEEKAPLAGTGMTVLMEDGNVLTIVIKGDIDGDGEITASDARTALRIAVGLDTPTEAQENAGLVKEFVKAENAEDNNAEEDETEEDVSGEEESDVPEEDASGDEEDATDETEPSEPSDGTDETEEPATAITAEDARAILRAAVSLENVDDWFAAVTAEPEEEPEEEPAVPEEPSSEEETSSEDGEEDTEE